MCYGNFFPGLIPFPHEHAANLQKASRNGGVFFFSCMVFLTWQKFYVTIQTEVIEITRWHARVKRGVLRIQNHFLNKGVCDEELLAHGLFLDSAGDSEFASERPHSSRGRQGCRKAGVWNCSQGSSGICYRW